MSPSSSTHFALNRKRNKTGSIYRTTRPSLELLEHRLAPANLVQSLYPDVLAAQGGGGFGYTTASSAEFHVIGVPSADFEPVWDQGAAYVYSATTGAFVAALDNPSPAIADQFGFSVAVSGNTVVVGAPTDDT